MEMLGSRKTSPSDAIFCHVFKLNIFFVLGGGGLLERGEEGLLENPSSRGELVREGAYWSIYGKNTVDMSF